MNVIFNRLRGTKSWWAKVNAALLCFITLLIYENPYVSFAVAFGYIAGESMGWGEWVGWLTRLDGEPAPKRSGLKNGIYWLASKLFKVDTIPYHLFSLFLRGLWWWIPTLAPLYFVDNAYRVTAAILFLAVMFPFSVLISNLMKPDDTAWEEWEDAEYIYGGYQDIALTALFLTYLLIGV